MSKRPKNHTFPINHLEFENFLKKVKKVKKTKRSHLHEYNLEFRDFLKKFKTLKNSNKIRSVEKAKKKQNITLMQLQYFLKNAIVKTVQKDYTFATITLNLKMRNSFKS